MAQSKDWGGLAFGLDGQAYGKSNHALSHGSGGYGFDQSSLLAPRALLIIYFVFVINLVRVRLQWQTYLRWLDQRHR